MRKKSAKIEGKEITRKKTYVGLGFSMRYFEIKSAKQFILDE